MNLIYNIACIIGGISIIFTVLVWSAALLGMLLF